MLAQAAQLAASQGKSRIDPLHLFFGLTNQAELGITIEVFAHKGKHAPTRTAPPSAIALSPTSKKIILNAAALANAYNHSYIGTEHLFMSLLESRNAKIEHIVQHNNLDTKSLRNQLEVILQSSSKIFDMLQTLNPPETAEEHECGHDHGHEQHNAPKTKTKKISALEYFSVHLTAPEYAKKLDPLIGRATEVDRLMRILLRRTKNNPVLLGDPGVGKTALVEGLAQKIVTGDVPEPLQGKKIYALSLTAMIAGSAFRGELEIRFKQVIEDVQADPSVILFIDEIHNLVGAGSSPGSLDVANILKPALARGELRCIGATTFQEYKKHIEEDAALDRRFQPIHLDEPSLEEAVRILEGIKGAYERHHEVDISPEAILGAVTLSDRYIPEKKLPDKAIDLLDEACAKTKLERVGTACSGDIAVVQRQLEVIMAKKEYALYQEHDLARAQSLHEEELQTKEVLKNLVARPRVTVTHEMIAGIVSSATGIPADRLTSNEREALLKLEERLSEKIVGQDHAKKEIARFVRRAKAGFLPKGRPVASFLFTGPSGVGKTECAKALAAELFGSRGLIKLDMSEFGESFTISRLIGAPSGYIGYKEGGKLTESVRQRPHSLVLFDEIEKAHPKIINILLQILDEGVLTDAAGKKIDFSHAMIVLTSNIGAKKLQNGSLGFASEGAGSGGISPDRIRDELKEVCGAELLNRIDSTLVFSHLEEAQLTEIARRHIDTFGVRVREEHGLILAVPPAVSKFIIAKARDEGDGARNIRRVVERELEHPIAECILSSPQGSIRSIHLSIKNGRLTITARSA